MLLQRLSDVNLLCRKNVESQEWSSGVMDSARTGSLAWRSQSSAPRVLPYKASDAGHPMRGNEQEGEELGQLLLHKDTAK